MSNLSSIIASKVASLKQTETTRNLTAELLSKSTLYKAHAAFVALFGPLSFSPSDLAWLRKFLSLYADNANYAAHRAELRVTLADCSDLLRQFLEYACKDWRVTNYQTIWEWLNVRLSNLKLTPSQAIVLTEFKTLLPKGFKRQLQSPTSKEEQADLSEVFWVAAHLFNGQENYERYTGKKLTFSATKLYELTDKYYPSFFKHKSATETLIPLLLKHNVRFPIASISGSVTPLDLTGTNEFVYSLRWNEKHIFLSYYDAKELVYKKDMDELNLKGSERCLPAALAVLEKNPGNTNVRLAFTRTVLSEVGTVIFSKANLKRMEPILRPLSPAQIISLSAPVNSLRQDLTSIYTFARHFEVPLKDLLHKMKVSVLSAQSLHRSNTGNQIVCAEVFKACLDTGLTTEIAQELAEYLNKPEHTLYLSKQDLTKRFLPALELLSTDGIVQLLTSAEQAALNSALDLYSTVFQKAYSKSQV